MKSAPRFLPIAILVGAVTIVVSAQTSKAPRTSWGAPDLQGIWNTNTFLPLERAAKFGTRPTMTEEEHAKELAELQERNKRPGRDSRDVAGKPGVGTEKGRGARVQRVLVRRQPTKLSYSTSMVIDPATAAFPRSRPSGAAHRGEKRIPRGAAAGHIRRTSWFHSLRVGRSLAGLQPRSHQPRRWT
jgi:hypothetical protein